MEITDLNHIAIHVKDVAASRRFYGDLLGLKPKKRPDFDFDGAWFQLGPVRELHILEGREIDVVSHHRGAHFAFEVPDIQVAKAELEAAGVKIERGPQTRPDGAQQIFVLDPDGYWVEFSDISNVPS